MSATIDLQQVVSRLADRRPERTESNVQSDLHLLLVAAPLDLVDAQLEEIILESPVGVRRRIDVEVGQAVFEVKRDLRVGNVRAEAEIQLAGYVRERAMGLEHRYVGVLTDGAEWHLYRLVGDDLVLTSSYVVPTPVSAAAVEGLSVWLEAVLATSHRVAPTPREILRRLGADSPAHVLDFAELMSLYQADRARPEVALKRALWSKLLTTALGTAFEDEDELFVEHTLLVMTAEIIAHAVVGIDPADPSITPRTLVGGGLFAQAQVGGVVESDFFDWVVDVPGGGAFVRLLARRLSRFVWGDVEHDVMKVLYESVISAAQRHSLGEYYTPDWLAEETVLEAVSEPLSQRVLDPSCGSGTFVFHAVRRYLAEAEAAGMSNADALIGATTHVAGVDVHPVAVTLARVTYLLAIGLERLQASDRPAFSVPVYLGDSVQWGQQRDLLSSETELTIATDDGQSLFADELSFPRRLLDDASRFDRLVAELSDKASSRDRGSAVPSLVGTFRLFAVHPEDQALLSATFTTMCQLHDAGRNHIWGYYVRNLVRPTWLAREGNRVDVLVGNPPWLAYRFMPASMQESYRALTVERDLWTGRGVATHQDLSALFVIRCVELYLREGGRFAFVMPLAALSRTQFAPFRSGLYQGPHHRSSVSFDRPWDMHQVKPSFFPVPASVVFGRKTSQAAVPMPDNAEQWSGRIPVWNASRDVAAPHLRRSDSETLEDLGVGSLYASRFVQGATVVPRLLLIVEPNVTTGLGVGAGRRSIRSARSPKEKRPWKLLPGLTGNVESQFVRPLFIGETLLPHRTLEPLQTVVPWDGERLLDEGDDRLQLYPGLAGWWGTASAVWRQHRSSERMTLHQRLDFRRGLSQQFPAPPQRVVYSASGMYLAAARLEDPEAVVEHKLYWAAAASITEARYLTGILNSAMITKLVRPLQARGEHNPRDFDKYVFQVGIPLFDPNNDDHMQLASLGKQAEQLAASIELPAGKRFELYRRLVREALAASQVGAAIEVAVASLLAPAAEVLGLDVATLLAEPIDLDAIEDDPMGDDAPENVSTDRVRTLAGSADETA
jgi:SAM-dependent methyltransferase